MAYYKLKVGSHTDGAGVTQRFFHAKDPKRNIVESDFNLAEYDPNKFERFDGVPPEGSLVLTRPGQPSKATKTTVSTAPAHSGAYKDEAKGSPYVMGAHAAKVEDRAPTREAAVKESASHESGDDLDTLTVHDLKQLAADEEIDLGGATLKADILKAVRKARSTAAGH